MNSTHGRVQPSFGMRRTFRKVSIIPKEDGRMTLQCLIPYNYRLQHNNFLDRVAILILDVILIPTVLSNFWSGKGTK